MLLILTIINSLAIVLIGTVVFFNRRYILKDSKADMGLVDLKAVQQQEKEDVDSINRRFAESFREEFPFMSDY